MTDPLGLIGSAGRASSVGPERAAAPGSPGAQPGQPSFRDVLMQNIERVGELEQDATRAIEDLQSGKRTDLEGVLLATQKADTAFRMLQAVRNKVVQAYEEIKQMRV
jgi:flagellar hook-basal body complex protein FliE